MITRFVHLSHKNLWDTLCWRSPHKDMNIAQHNFAFLMRLFRLILFDKRKEESFRITRKTLWRGFRPGASLSFTCLLINRGERIKFCKAHPCTYIPFVRCVSVYTYTGAALMRVCMYVMYKKKKQDAAIMFSRHMLYNYSVYVYIYVHIYVYGNVERKRWSVILLNFSRYYGRRILDAHSDTHIRI